MTEQPRPHLKTTLPAADYSEIISSARRMLGQTQKELAIVLGVSVKAIQSYEQGWRDVPIRVIVQILMLIAIQQQGDTDKPPCWEITNCPEKERNICPSYAIGHGQFCWFVAARSCRRSRNSTDSEWPCAMCPVIADLLFKKSGGKKRPKRM